MMWSSERNKYVVLLISCCVSSVETASLPISGLKYILMEDVFV